MKNNKKSKHIFYAPLFGLAIAVVFLFIKKQTLELNFEELISKDIFTDAIGVLVLSTTLYTYVLLFYNLWQYKDNEKERKNILDINFYLIIPAILLSIIFIMWRLGIDTF